MLRPVGHVQSSKGIHAIAQLVDPRKALIAVFLMTVLLKRMSFSKL